MKSETIYIYGKHALVEALTNAPHAVKKVHLSPQLNDKELLNLVAKTKVNTAVLKDGGVGPGMDRGAVHQGVIGVVAIDALMRPYKEFFDGLKVTPNTSLVLLGEVQDPQNVGAVIRSAAAFGVAGVLIPTHNQAQVSGAVVKVSAGMAFRIPLISIGNVNTVVRDLKDRGFWIYGLDASGEHTVTDESFEEPTVLILGNEARGMRAETRKSCDVLLSIPMHPQCESLNAAASAAVVLYSWSAKHQGALTN